MTTTAQDWFLFTGDGKKRPWDPEKLPGTARWRAFHQRSASARRVTDEEGWTPPATPDPRARRFMTADELQAVNLALALRRPLLVDGPPGSGKSAIAYAIAHELDLGPVLKWPITSRSQRQDGLYAFDAVARVHAARATQDTDDSSLGIHRFIRLGPLGTAFVDHGRPRVVLIDEIDKASLDLPNDLLHVLEDARFTIQELERVGASDVEVAVADQDGAAKLDHSEVICGETFPIVVMTNNGERAFPPAFLRRCVRLSCGHPSTAKALASIAVKHQLLDEEPATEEDATRCIPRPCPCGRGARDHLPGPRRWEHARERGRGPATRRSDARHAGRERTPRERAQDPAQAARVVTPSATDFWTHLAAEVREAGLNTDVIGLLEIGHLLAWLGPPPEPQRRDRIEDQEDPPHDAVVSEDDDEGAGDDEGQEQQVAQDTTDDAEDPNPSGPDDELTLHTTTQVEVRSRAPRVRVQIPKPPIRRAFSAMRLDEPDPDRRRWTLDEDATAQRLATDEDMPLVWAPATRKAATLDLILDVGSTVDPWWARVRQLVKTLRGLGVFHDLRCWTLNGDDPSAHLTLGALDGNPAYAVAPSRWGGRGGHGRLTLVVSDLRGSLWTQGPGLGHLSGWARGEPVALAQLLPRRHWSSTALEWTVPGSLSSDRPLTSWQAQAWSTTSAWSEPTPALRLPVFLLGPAGLHRWAGWLKGSTGNAITARELVEIPDEGEMESDDQTQPGSASAALARFLTTCTTQAARLLPRLLAAPYLSLRTLELVRRLTDTPDDPSILSEILESGLVVPSGERSRDLDENRWTWAAGVPEQLSDYLAIDELARLSLAVQAEMGAGGWQTWLAAFEGAGEDDGGTAWPGLAIQARRMADAGILERVLPQEPGHRDPRTEALEILRERGLPDDERIFAAIAQWSADLDGEPGRDLGLTRHRVELDGSEWARWRHLVGANVAGQALAERADGWSADLVEAIVSAPRVQRAPAPEVAPKPLSEWQESLAASLTEVHPHRLEADAIELGRELRARVPWFEAPAAMSWWLVGAAATLGLARELVVLAWDRDKTDVSLGSLALGGVVAQWFAEETSGLSTDARRAVALAAQHIRASGQEWLDTEHLVRALIRVHPGLITTWGLSGVEPIPGDTRLEFPEPDGHHVALSACVLRCLEVARRLRQRVTAGALFEIILREGTSPFAEQLRDQLSGGPALPMGGAMLHVRPGSANPDAEELYCSSDAWGTPGRLNRRVLEAAGLSAPDLRARSDDLRERGWTRLEAPAQEVRCVVTINPPLEPLVALRENFGAAWNGAPHRETLWLAPLGTGAAGLKNAESVKVMLQTMAATPPRSGTVVFSVPRRNLEAVKREAASILKAPVDHPWRRRWEIAPDPDYAGRRGYDPDFLGDGHHVALPTLSPAQRGDVSENTWDEDPATRHLLPYHHFSVCLCRSRRLPWFTASNLDGSRTIELRRIWYTGDRWHFDPRVPREHQLGHEVYRACPFDRGHVHHLRAGVWGRSFEDANRAWMDGFHWTNGSPQHERFNRGRTLWGGLEDYILDRAVAQRMRVCVFAGPVFGSGDPEHRGVPVPGAFWKVVVWVSQGRAMASAYLLSQLELVESTVEGSYSDPARLALPRPTPAVGEEVAFGPWGDHQVSIADVERLSGLDMTHLRAWDTAGPSRSSSVDPSRIEEAIAELILEERGPRALARDLGVERVELERWALTYREAALAALQKLME